MEGRGGSLVCTAWRMPSATLQHRAVLPGLQWCSTRRAVWRYLALSGCSLHLPCCKRCALHAAMHNQVCEPVGVLPAPALLQALRAAGSHAQPGVRACRGASRTCLAASVARCTQPCTTRCASLSGCFPHLPCCKRCALHAAMHNQVCEPVGVLPAPVLWPSLRDALMDGCVCRPHTAPVLCPPLHPECLPTHPGHATSASLSHARQFCCRLLRAPPCRWVPWRPLMPAPQCWSWAASASRCCGPRTTASHGTSTTLTTSSRWRLQPSCQVRALCLP